jgi:hypothetical protein
MHLYDFNTSDDDVDKAVDELTKEALSSKNKQVCIIMDEVVVRKKYGSPPKPFSIIVKKKVVD